MKSYNITDEIIEQPNTIGIRRFIGSWLSSEPLIIEHTRNMMHHDLMDKLLEDLKTSLVPLVVELEQDQEETYTFNSIDGKPITGLQLTSRLHIIPVKQQKVYMPKFIRTDKTMTELFYEKLYDDLICLEPA